MAELNKDYRCGTCGNVVKVLQSGIGELVCCGQPMNIVVEEAPATTETTLPGQPEQSMPPVPETPKTPTEELNQEKPQV